MLEGIDEGDWRKLKQLVIEVHDIEGRVEKMRSALDCSPTKAHVSFVFTPGMLEKRGYHVVVDQEPLEIHKLFEIYTIYAMPAPN